MNHNEEINRFYASDEFMESNLYHDVDSPWKVEKMLPYVDHFMEIHKRQNPGRGVTLADAGGGTGLVLKGVADHIRSFHRIPVTKIALDLSPGFLERSRENNPDLSRAIQGNIENTPLDEKEVDLLLLVDVLEHLPDPMKAYRELRRIARFVLFKVPLERNLTVFALESLTGYRTKRKKTVGHINFYAYRSLFRELEANLGRVRKAGLMNVFSHLLGSPERRRDLSLPRKLYCMAGRTAHGIAPATASLIFNDFSLYLVECL